MERENEYLQQIEALRERLSRLSEASLRINETLDLDTVLSEVVHSARTLADARYGGITLLDQSGQFQAFVTSGLTEEERQALMNLPDALPLFEFLSSQNKPIRLGDFSAQARFLGVTSGLMPLTSFLGAPIRHQGEPMGNFYLANKEGGLEFTGEDEEALVMFASQAALVIANARRHQDEQRARADLEALVDTAPIGVLVIDARTGTPVSVNAEARRIVSDLSPPHSEPEHLLDTLTVRRADGREVSLQELSLAQVLSAGETVRAEEIVVEVRGGGSVTALVNATPIRSEEGDLVSYIITVQDMTAQEELERLRAEFLAMVSHELRTPLTSIMGSATALLDDTSGLHPAEMRQFHQIIMDQTHRMRGLIADLLDVARIETGTLSVSPEPTDLTALLDEARNAFLSAGHKHDLQVDLVADLPWVMADRTRMVQVLGNLLTNAARHSPDSSSIRVSAVLGEFQVAVSVSDEGRGFPADSLPHLFRKFSRIAAEDQGGDTGLGLAVCKGIVEAHGGRIWAESDGPGHGARFTFTLPTVEDAGFVSPVAPSQATTSVSRRKPEERVRVLTVDDDPQALRYIRDALVKEGFTAIATSDPKEVPFLLEEKKPHLVLLDLMLPGKNGIDLMKEIVVDRDVPVIFVSAYGQDQLVARAFETGAADYVVKPFSPTELVARIRAALRRRETAEPAVPYAVGDLVINYEERLVIVSGNPVPVTAFEYKMLLELSASAGRVLTYEHLLRRVWDDEGDGDVRRMRTAISELRRKLGDDAGNPTYIFTEPRVGYRMPKPEGQVPGPGGSR